MRRRALLPLVLTLPFLLMAAGCGGDDGEDVETANPFTGTADGTYATDATTADAGTIRATVSRDGRLTATLASNVTAGATGTISGRVTDAGAFTGSATLPGATGAVAYVGTLRRPPQSPIQGELSPASGASGPGIAFVLGAVPR